MHVLVNVFGVDILSNILHTTQCVLGSIIAKYISSF